MIIQQDLQQLCTSLVGRTEGNLYLAVGRKAKTNNSSSRTKTLEYDPFYLDHICTICNVSKRNLKGRTRKREVVYARFICYWYLFNSTVLSVGSIGSIFDRDHATVLNGLRVHNDFKDINDRAYMQLVEKFNSKIKKRYENTLQESI